MKTATRIEIPICEECNYPIQIDRDGFVIQGNIYAAACPPVGWIIGDNFPRDAAVFGRDEVATVAYCKPCFLKVLGMEAIES